MWSNLELSQSKSFQGFEMVTTLKTVRSMDIKKLEDNKKRGSCFLTQTISGLLWCHPCTEALCYSCRPCRNKCGLHHHGRIVARKYRHDTVWGGNRSSQKNWINAHITDFGSWGVHAYAPDQAECPTKPGPAHRDPSVHRTHPTRADWIVSCTCYIYRSEPKREKWFIKKTKSHLSIVG